MDPITTAAANGLQANMDSIDMLANNIANASTNGFKADREFYSTYIAPEIQNGSDTTVGESPVVQRQWTDFAQGTLLPTGSATDLALSGNGFFVVSGPNGPLYTRNGNFRISKDGSLLTAEGYPVLLTDGKPAQLSGSDPMSVQNDGSIMQDGNLVGQLKVVDFSDPSKLSRLVGPYFQVSDPQAAQPKSSSAQVVQGQIESSNAQPSEAAARMISLLRHFDMLQRAIKIGTDMNGQAIQEVARVTS
jgi:flagellar basal-body rod protein FlgF